MKTEAFDYAFFEDDIVNIKDARVSIMTHSLQYGTAVFGGIRAYYDPKQRASYLFRLEDHYKRLLASTRLLGCPFEYSLEDLQAKTIELVKRNRPQTDAYIRPYAYVGDTGIGPSLFNKRFSLSIYMIALGNYLPTDKGLNMMVSSWRRIADTAIPSLAKASGGYVNASLARKEADEHGFDEAIMLTEDGHVSEGSAENIFLVREGRLITPAASEGILEGITRRSIITLAKDMGIAVEARPIERSELYVADEVFLSGTACQVTWVEHIDGRRIGSGRIGPVTKQLQDKFFQIVRGDGGNYGSWLTKVELAG